MLLSRKTTAQDSALSSWRTLADELGVPSGLGQYDNCALAARKFVQVAAQLKAVGKLQHDKALAIIRTWDRCCELNKEDATCGVTNLLLHVLASPTPSGVPCIPQVRMRTDLSLWLLPIDKLMEPESMPATVRNLREEAVSVSCGFVHAHGTFRVWANDRFSAEYMSAEKVNNWLADTGLLPFFWFGTIFSPASRDNFYEYMAEHMLADSSEGHTTSMFLETVGRDGQLMKRLLTIRYEILNGGQNSYFAINLRPLQYSDAAVHDSIATSVSFSSTLISTPQLSLSPRSMSRARIGAFLAGGEKVGKRMEKKNEEAVADSTTEHRDSQENCVRYAASGEGEMVIAAKRARHHDKRTCFGFRRTVFVGHAYSESHTQALQHQPEILRPSLGQAKTSSTDWFPCSGGLHRTTQAKKSLGRHDPRYDRSHGSRISDTVCSINTLPSAAGSTSLTHSLRAFERDVSKGQAPAITQASVSPTDIKRQPQQQQNVQQQEEQLYYRNLASQKHLWPPSPNDRLTRLNRPQCWVTCQRQQQHKERSVQASANQVKSSQQYGAKLPSEKHLTPQQQWDMAKKQHYQLQYQLSHPAKASYGPKHGHRTSRTRAHHQSLFKRRYPQPPGNVQTISCDEAEIDSASSSTSSSASLPGSRSFSCSSDSTSSSGSGYEKFRLHHSQDPAAQNLCGTGASRTFGSRVFVGVSPLRLESEDVRQHLELRPPECYQPCLDRSRDNFNDSSTYGKEDIYLIDKTFTRAGDGQTEGWQEDERALRSEESPNAMLAELDDYFSSDWRID